MSPYDNYNNRNKAPKRRLGVIGIVMMVITIIISAMLTASYTVQYISPGRIWWPAMLGLIAPILYILCAILLLYWIIRWSKIFFVPLVALLLGLGAAPRFIKPVISKKHTVVSDRNAIKIMSYNVRGFIDFEQNRAYSTMDSILHFIGRMDPDIICFQEYQTTPEANQKLVDSILNKLTHKRLKYKVQGNDGTGWGIAVFSRFPIVRSESVEFAESTNMSQWVDIVPQRGDTIRVFNNHLQSFLISAEDKEFIMNKEFFTGGDIEIPMRDILSKLQRGYTIRASQADSLAMLIHRSPYDVVVCGDFNDTPMSYVYRTMRGDMADSFVEKGRGIVNNTYRGFYNLFRIDYILHSKSYEALDYQIPQNEFSDHNPVWVAMRKKPTGGK